MKSVYRKENGSFPKLLSARLPYYDELEKNAEYISCLGMNYFSDRYWTQTADEDEEGCILLSNGEPWEICDCDDMVGYPATRPVVVIDNTESKLKPGDKFSISGNPCDNECTTYTFTVLNDNLAIYDEILNYDLAKGFDDQIAFDDDGRYDDDTEVYEDSFIKTRVDKWFEMISERSSKM